MWNVTGGAAICVGGSAYSNSSASAQGATHSRCRTLLTVAVATTIRMEHRCAATRAADGLGLACGFGVPEVYGGVNVRRVA